MATIRTRLTLTAGLVIIVLTAAAFWLSYAHLHDVAAEHGLGDSPWRAWAWPATLDLFIVAGEVMMLVAALAKRRDLWAIGLTTAGSVGSIGLNVFGVGPGAPLIEYVVAAVPPSAALLAFGALMRQIHHAVAAEEAAGLAPAQAGPAVNEPAPVLHKMVGADTIPARFLVQEEVQGDAEARVSAPSLAAVVDEVQAADDSDGEEAEEDGPIVEEVQVFTAPTKPSLDDISKAVEDIEREGRSLSGKALAEYFGVSDRSGRRYLTDWKAAQEAAA
ncbi:DUF2637 domain-containing protein [Streptomyces sp. NPDC000851]